ncbi:hypothetical protein E5288_WYG007663 [Bos mutus]|uniref:Uncharacterized protein n=1 Tax=Bos mutus TaxID=72004 RepID=A0A6B0R9V5_9CETA|nr:hypothetical protein [Bos mutus]
MPSLSPGKGLLAASQEAAEAEAGGAVRPPLSVLTARPKQTKQSIRIANDQASTIGLSVSFHKSEATGHVQQRVMVWRDSDAGKRLDFSFVSNRASCLSAQTPSQGVTAVSLAHRACSDMYKRVSRSPWQPAPPSCRLQHFLSATDFQTFQ